ncbi:hypothetical protein GPJ56_001072 [Histomonas meleagridis]|uniref:uncharacterized protein n=1 Tax=Histomonas meleagridis TaxID=135588 RepID=UPI00355A6AB1|nr:hypothetical protein GPJ56_001072 [Histomonas meleagridis]KAH0804861.1 hypothetical protein GO595_002375 [Histomonas meleagridis]
MDTKNKMATQYFSKAEEKRFNAFKLIRGNLYHIIQWSNELAYLYQDETDLHTMLKKVIQKSSSIAKSLYITSDLKERKNIIEHEIYEDPENLYGELQTFLKDKMYNKVSGAYSHMLQIISSQDNSDTFDSNELEKDLSAFKIDDINSIKRVSPTLSSNITKYFPNNTSPKVDKNSPQNEVLRQANQVVAFTNLYSEVTDIINNHGKFKEELKQAKEIIKDIINKQKKPSSMPQLNYSPTKQSFPFRQGLNSPPKPNNPLLGNSFPFLGGTEGQKKNIQHQIDECVANYNKISKENEELEQKIKEIEEEIQKKKKEKEENLAKIKEKEIEINKKSNEIGEMKSEASTKGQIIHDLMLEILHMSKEYGIK